MNECQENEYRCRSGQCIPEDFVQDDYFTPDCLDTSDETITDWIDIFGKEKLIRF
jgi:hypothetical protein